MAEEIATSAGKKVGMATLKTFSSPSINIVKVIPQGIIELSLRGAAVALGFVALISAAACQGAVESINIALLAGNSGVTVPSSPTHSAGGWTIFLSFWVMLYQALAIVQLFLHIKLAYRPVPVVNWSYFFLIDIIAIGIAAGGYFCSAVSMAAYAGRWAALDGMNGVSTGMVTSSAGATSAFSFFALILFIGMIVYFLLARYVFLWPSHGDVAPAGGKSASKEEDYAPEE